MCWLRRPYPESGRIFFVGKKDFFISYNHQDEGWAEWIAWQLEEVGYEVLIQKWDMGPGSHFVQERQRAAEVCHRTLIVLSPRFLASEYTQPEWTQAFARDPTGEKRLLIPVRVAECELQGFFKPLVYIDFFPLVTEPPASEQDKREVIRQLRQRLQFMITAIKYFQCKSLPLPEGEGIGAVKVKNYIKECYCGH
jgi:hypothetical protein